MFVEVWHIRKVPTMQRQGGGGNSAARARRRNNKHGGKDDRDCDNDVWAPNDVISLQHQMRGRGPPLVGRRRMGQQIRWRQDGNNNDTGSEDTATA